MPPNVGTTGAEGVTGSEDVEGVEKVIGVEDVDGTNGVTPSKWEGLVDENDPIMLLSMVGFQELTVLVDPNTGKLLNSAL